MESRLDVQRFRFKLWPSIEFFEVICPIAYLLLIWKPAHQLIHCRKLSLTFSVFRNRSQHFLSSDPFSLSFDKPRKCIQPSLMHVHYLTASLIPVPTFRCRIIPLATRMAHFLTPAALRMNSEPRGKIRKNGGRSNRGVCVQRARTEADGAKSWRPKTSGQRRAERIQLSALVSCLTRQTCVSKDLHALKKQSCLNVNFSKPRFNLSQEIFLSRWIRIRKIFSY